jgi:predicted TIM-barrel fold metal-dependent hydrolase
MSRIILVSCDSHAAGSLESYRPYLEARYHDALDEHIARDQANLDRYGLLRGYDDDELALIDEERAIRSGGRSGAQDPQRRLREMDREGVVCEVVQEATADDRSQRCLPFASRGYAPYPAELRAAGARAFNRWLADMMAETGGRVVGTAEAGPCVDMDAEVAELEWAAEHGFVSVQVPGRIVEPGLRVPRVYDREYFERFWAACVDLGLALNVHAGWGGAQSDQYQLVVGELSEGFEFDELTTRVTKLTMENTPSNYIQALGLTQETFESGNSHQSREPLWQFMLGGAFDRHPALRFVLTELRSDWVPATLAALDERVARGGTPLKLKPSEYFARNCRVTPSFPHPAEIAIRHQIGVRQIMFGRDYPHNEGTWPNTWDWIRAAYAGVPEDEARLMLGENAIEWYGLDRARLAALAETIGPRPEDLLGDHAVDPRLIANFDKRGGFGKPAEQANTAAVVEGFDKDLATAQHQHARQA